MPKLTSTKITVAAITVAIIALFVGGLLVYRSQNSDQILAQTYMDGFVNSPSAVVRVTNLARLFRLGGEFAVQARNLFFDLDTEQQLALFTDLTAPEQVGEDLQIAIKNIYTHLENSEHPNALLQAMADDLNKIKAAFPDSVILYGEINTWLAGRSLSQVSNYEEAIASYTRAVSYNNQNPAIYLDRALAYSHLEQYHDALTDLSRVIELDPERRAQVTALIRSNPALRDYLTNHQGDFPNLAKSVS